ncbi:hypothetical protein GR160_18460 [Flavobacterium sp. Sd200]|uniref:hypothetical protein n=1 Tax=Flavobacterium sp. Sd200 TaxID=2692211 RepID=UPI00136D5A6D|nr:hypothetical protein [Flavobacterium sp. Sd200]MXN93216.1 hypothetical protein [Flavobacterium sp. Sd200]
METNGKNQLDRDTLQLVLEEFTVEQKTTNQNIGELIIAIDNLGKKLDGFNEQQASKSEVPVSIDIAPVKSALEKGFLDIKYMIGREPKSITRKLQILLFPEQDAKLFYRIVFGRWFLLPVAAFALNLAYSWGIDYTQSKKEVEIQQLENDRIRNSWDYMYRNNDKAIKIIMNKAYNFSVKGKDK